VSYQSPYAAPSYIDRVWRSLIGYDTKYKEICYKTCYGYLLRVDPHENLENRYSTYERCRTDMMLRKHKLNPFFSLWPQYKNSTDYINDYKYNVWVSLPQLKGFIDYISQNPMNIEHLTAEECIRESQSIVENHQRQFPPKYQGRPSYSDKIYFDEDANEKWTSNCDNDEVQMCFNSIIDFEFPESFTTHISRELMISTQQAEDSVCEYRKFMMIEGMTKYKLYPSELIDKVWLIHMSYSTNYINFCKQLPEKEFVYHIPFTGNSKGFDDVKNYKTTLSVYKLLYREDPPNFVWPPAKQRFHPENFSCVFVNLIRLAGMYNVYHQGYLKPQQNQPVNIDDIDVKGIDEPPTAAAMKQEVIKSKKKYKSSSYGYNSSSNST